MGSYKEITGDLIELSNKGEFDVVVHGCNCFCVMGAGIAPLMAKNFGCDKFKLEDSEFKGDINKLGNIDFRLLWFEDNNRYTPYPDEDGKFTTHSMYVVNAYTQYSYGKNRINGIENPLSYEALSLCMTKINKTFNGKKIGLPMIGCGLAGGDWSIVSSIIKRELKDCDVTIVRLKK